MNRPKMLRIIENTDDKHNPLNTPYEIIEDQIKSSIKRMLPQVRPWAINDQIVAIVAGGPSTEMCRDELQELVFDGVKIVAVNNAYTWCLENNFRPSVSVVVDAQEHCAKWLQKDIPTCQYFLASQCHPTTFDMVQDRNTTIFHCLNNQGEIDILDEYYSGNWYQVIGGSTVTLRTIMLMRMLGFEKLHVFGFDSCYLDGKDHSYDQPENSRDKPVLTVCEDKEFWCTGWHVSQAIHFKNLIKSNGNSIRLSVHGDGLIAHMIKTGAELHRKDGEPLDELEEFDHGCNSVGLLR
jgi:hypothetical protein